MSLWVDVPATIGPYILGGILGTGAFALVVEAADSLTHSKYAVKIVPKSTIPGIGCDQFEREVRMLIDLKHLGVVRLHDFRADDIYCYLVMELIRGPTIMATSPGPGVINEAGARPLFRQLIDVVSYLHSQNIAHRDLKLDNILIDNTTGQVKVIDFGFSRTASPGELLRVEALEFHINAREEAFPLTARADC